MKVVGNYDRGSRVYMQLPRKEAQGELEDTEFIIDNKLQLSLKIGFLTFELYREWSDKDF